MLVQELVPEQVQVQELGKELVLGMVSGDHHRSQYDGMDPGMELLLVLLLVQELLLG